MYPHHREAIDKPTRHFEADKEPTAVYLGGSIAHGFERPDCDVDLIVVVDDEAYAERQFLVDSELNWLDGEPQVDDL